MAPHPDLAIEQAYIERAYDRLEELRANAAARMAEVLDQGRGGTFQAREERDVIVRSSLARIEQLNLGQQALVFGRIDVAPEEPREGEAGALGATFHIGRLGVSGRDQDQLVVDWRAPVAEPFYRATGREPMGISRRRHFATEGRRLLDIEDELFAASGAAVADAAGDEDDWGEVLVPAGEASVPSGALLAALEQSRSGHMRDIVATIQREQDEIIRAPLAGLLVVQGGPGTGKTAVALHRAAYLLYTHRFPLERQGVLVIGPNQLFLRYIGQVLPSLGESGVALSAVAGLVPGVEVRADEASSLARLKGEARMAQVLARAVRDRERPLRREVEVPFGVRRLVLSPDDSAEIVSAARRRRGTHNARRALVEQLVVGRLHEQLVQRDGQPSEDDDGDLREELRHLAAVEAACERMWPRLLGEELVHDLFGAPPLIALAGRSVLSASERAELARPRSASLDAIPWTLADIPLVDEARTLVGPVRSVPEDAEARTYGHIVVDEAQNLTPMQLRLLGRRSLSGSMTIVGDLAQATGPGAARHWDDIVSHLPARGGVREVELSVNYRTPAAVMEVADQVLDVAAPGLRPPRSFRLGGRPPTFVESEPDRLVDDVSAVVQGERAAAGEGTVGVLGPERLVAELTSVLGASATLEDPVSVLPVRLARGLEFDAVVVVEPSEIVAEAEGDLRALYVALTRTTRQLAVVHAQPLPQPLAAAAAQLAVAEA